MVPNVATDPLIQIQQHIGQARSLPAPRPYSPATQPMDRLLRLIDDARAGRDPEPDGVPSQSDAQNDTPKGPPSSTSSPAATTPPGSLDAIVGQQILASLESRPLSGAARAETVRRLALAMQNPTRENLQTVLDVLLSGDPATGQSRQ